MLLEKTKEMLLPFALIEEIEVEKEIEEPAEAPSDEEQAEEKAEEKKVEVEIVSQPAIHATDYNAKGYNLDVKVLPENVVAVAEKLLELEFFIEAVTGVDWIKDKQMEVVYDFDNWTELCRVTIRTRVDRENPEVPTISEIYSGANWHERETHDFFGIKFTGHPDLSPLLLPDDADYHPLLKDFKA